MACSFKNSQNFFMQSLSLSCLSSMLRKEDMVDIDIVVYFCCRWIFRIIFIPINLFYYTFKICINNKWCFIRFLILIKFRIFWCLLKVLQRHKKKFFSYFFMRFKLVFCCKRMNVIETINSSWCLGVIPINNANGFLTAR